ncbi:hypothetical protein [Sorangium sp. So ce1335]|uniref:hypothetical protein n=1 Tax=Sorangium sp. So ce1335 TaxID=3133335 RepID=UPI003F643C35
MRDDELLRAVADAARAEDRASDPRWSARIRGALDERELAALEELARRDAEGREAWEASRPLDGEARGKIVERILAGMEAPEPPGDAPPARATPGAQAVGAAAAGAAAGQGAGKVLPLPVKRRAPAVLAATGALAAAAALLLVFRLAPPGSRDQGSAPTALPGAPSLPPVPVYAIAISGGEQALRSTNRNPGAEPAPGGEATSVGPESRLEITLRPATRVEGPLEVRAFLIRDGGARPWDVKVELSSQGAARIAGDRKTLFRGVPAGHLEIALAIGRPGSLPAGPEDVLRAPRLGPPPGYRLLRREIRLHD